MIIKQLDYLSPKITLFFQGNHRHSSLFSGIITILSYLTIFACIIYYTFEFIDRGNPTIYFFNRYVKDAGIFPLNSSAIFHYLYLITTSRIRNLTIDFKSISIYGIQKSLEQVGDLVGLTRERVRQIEISAITKLRNPARANVLAEYI